MFARFNKVIGKIAGVGLLCSLCACGYIADKDRIPVAEVDGEKITRGDLFEYIYRMPDDERPRIQHRRDLERVLEEWIETQLTEPLGEKLAEEGVIQVNREQAREFFFLAAGEEEEQYRAMWNLRLDDEDAPTELMRAYNLTPEMVRASHDMIELGTDEVVREMQAMQAVQYKARQDFEAGRISVDQEDIERAYAIRQDELQQLEQLVFRAIRFPASVEGAHERAGEVRRRLDEGAEFDDLVEEYGKLNSAFIIESEIENNPSLARFRGFWHSVSGAEEGEIVGPVYLPESQRAVEGPEGQMQTQTMPDSYLVLKVLEHEPARPLTIEEAEPMLIPGILYRKELDLLHEEHGVEIHEENLPEIRSEQDVMLDWAPEEA